MEKNYNYAAQLKDIWEKAVDQYQKGGRNVNLFLNGIDLEYLRSIGANPQDIYDFAEDFCEQGEPSWENFLLIQSVRRDYFLTVQHGQHSTEILDDNTLPAKTAEVRDIVWLPRIIEKAKAKLRGELPTSTMYSCGGDRKFLKTHDIHPADFLRAVWAYEDDNNALIEWVIAQSAAISGAD